MNEFEQFAAELRRFAGGIAQAGGNQVVIGAVNPVGIGVDGGTGVYASAVIGDDNSVGHINDLADEFERSTRDKGKLRALLKHVQPALPSFFAIEAGHLLDKI